MFTAYLDDIPILDDSSQQFSVFSFILFLFQIRRMLKLRENSSIAECFRKGGFMKVPFLQDYFKGLEKQRASERA